MSILRVALMGHPVLRMVAVPVPDGLIASEAVQRLIDDMLETVDACDGAGLAAPQVHQAVRIVVVNLDDGQGVHVWINPQVQALTEDVRVRLEGCLSLPRIRGAVARPVAVRVLATDRDGQPVDLELHGFAATVAQHECDHLDGVLFVDRVDPRTLTFLDELRRYGAWPWMDDDEEDEEDEENEEDDEDSLDEYDDLDEWPTNEEVD